ncbi:hypothetical protein J6590_093321 [Homalodisca vitripennis]|nr:hypothetical protein J6590_093321 [Homalodisca vitripennis]
MAGNVHSALIRLETDVNICSSTGRRTQASVRRRNIRVYGEFLCFWVLLPYEELQLIRSSSFKSSRALSSPPLRNILKSSTPNSLLSISWWGVSLLSASYLSGLLLFYPSVEAANIFLSFRSPQSLDPLDYSASQIILISQDNALSGLTFLRYI